jgi:NADPH:quinone reductase
MADIPDTMSAAALNRFGGPEELSLQRVAVPEPGDDEILLRIHTAGIGVWDQAEREGQMTSMIDWEPHFPYVPGGDAAGTVVATGKRVERFREGDRVYGSTFLSPKGGSYAQYSVLKEEQAAPLPSGLGLTEGGVLAIDGVTALQGLRDQLDLQEGETVLIFGASGGIGHLAVQIARRIGAHVIAIASGGDGVQLVDELDADVSVDGHGGDISEAITRVAPNGIDAALITATGEGLDEALSALREGARMAWPNGVRPEPQVPEGVRGSSYDGEPGREILDELNGILESGPFRVHVDKTFSLQDASRAHRTLGEHFIGKLALRVDEY